MTERNGVANQSISQKQGNYRNNDRSYKMAIEYATAGLQDNNFVFKTSFVSGHRVALVSSFLIVIPVRYLSQ